MNVLQAYKLLRLKDNHLHGIMSIALDTLSALTSSSKNEDEEDKENA